MISLDSFEPCCLRNSLCDRYCKIPTHGNTFDDFFSEMLLDKTLEDMPMFVGKQ